MFLTEDRIADWVDSTGGLLITRRICNVQTYNFINHMGLQYVCLTGYPQIIQQFFQKALDRFSFKIVLIIIESDVVELSPEWLDHPKLMHCFTWNKPFHHPKLSALPIGLNYNRQYNALTKWLGQQSVDTNADKQWVCMNYSPSTDPSRVKLIERAKNNWKNFCTIIDFIPNANVYVIHSHIEGQITVPVVNPECYSQWSKYKFVISPRGAGEDCHRTWEALHIGCIPIVLSSNLDELYHDLPILVVNSWDEITLSLLEESYDNIQKRKMENGYCMEKVTLQYWIERFQQVSKSIPKIHFITYANDVYENAKKRLLHEAHHFGEFISIQGLSPYDLSEEFNRKFEKILQIPRIAGCGIWRPEIILNKLKLMKDGEYLLYMDAGCKLNTRGKQRMFEYIELLDKSDKGLITIRMTGNNGFGQLCKEREYSRKEVFDYFKVDPNSEIGNNPQCLSGILLMKKNQHLMKIIELWLQCVHENPKMFTDIYDKPINAQDEQFIANRHEQSVLSILTQIYGSVNIDGDESWIPPFGHGESLKYPFWATRLKT